MRPDAPTLVAQLAGGGRWAALHSLAREAPRLVEHLEKQKGLTWISWNRFLEVTYLQMRQECQRAARWSREAHRTRRAALRTTDCVSRELADSIYATSQAQGEMRYHKNGPISREHKERVFRKLCFTAEF